MIVLSIAVAVLSADIAHAQDQFGAAVAVVGTDVLVVKPAAARGPAGVYLYRQTPDGWSLIERLYAEGAAASGEPLSASIAALDGGFIVASGDANAQWAGHVFQRAADEWHSGGRVVFDPDAATDAPGSVSLAQVMRILQPPQRRISARGNTIAASLLGGTAATNGVRIYERSGDDAMLEIMLRPDDIRANDQFGAALSLGEGRLVIGAPRGGGSGAAYVYRRTSNEWHHEVTLRTDDLARSAGLGSAVMVVDDVVLVSAPGTRNAPGVVIAFYFDQNAGEWTEVLRLAAEDGTPGDGFGTSLAGAAGEVWVGAPGANDQLGRVYRFVWDAAAGELRPGSSIDPVGVDPRSGFGSSVAVGDGVAVIGAPTADQAAGRAAVYTLGDDGEWSGGGWLSIVADFDVVAGEEIRCEDGAAAGFECNNVDLLAFLPTSAIGGGPGEGVTDLWGWTDSETGHEYALVGRTMGAAIVDVTDATNPTYLGLVAATPAGLRDLKVYQDHLFFVGDGAGNHGLVVFDLTRLRNVSATPTIFEPDTVYGNVASAHNLIIDTESGFAYPVGASGGGETCGGGLHMVDIREPKNPTFAGCYTDTEGLLFPGRTHDGQCTVYRGPDGRYTGRQVCFVSNETALRIVDVTDKDNPAPIAAARYPRLAYVHQGWLTEDQRYFYMDDELDELVGMADRTRTMVWDVAELDDPVFVGEFYGPEPATDHNLFIKGDRMYQANYQAGLRVWDVSDPEQPFEIGYFDTVPYDGNPAGFTGAFTAFPFFESGTVIVSSALEGLFILKPRRQELIP